MIAKLIATALSATLVLGTASATFAASKSKNHPAPRAATVMTTPQPDYPYYSYARGQTFRTLPARNANSEPSYFTLATGSQDAN